MIAKHMFKEKEKSNVHLVIRSGMSTRLHDGPVMLVPDATNDKFKRFLPWLEQSSQRCQKPVILLRLC